MEKARKSKWTANISLFVCALLYQIQGIHETAASVRKSAGSDERTALDQALLLVELLKSEYTKVLKENDNLKRKNKFDEANVQTCAATTERMSENLNDMFQHRRRWRPQLAAYNYYGDPIGIGKGKWRRLDYDEEFGIQPGGNKTRTNTAASTDKITTVSESHSPVAKTTTAKFKGSKYNETASTLSTTIIQTSTVVNKIVPNAKSEFNSRAPISNDSEIDSKVVTTKVRKKFSPSSDTYTVSNFVTIKSSSSRPVMIKLMAFSKKASEAKDISSTPVTQPELSQAAAELAKELGVAAPAQHHHGSVKGPRFPVLWRGSTKVYLADSTRYPLPLPENHAFCYYNPHSALCRTLV